MVKTRFPAHRIIIQDRELDIGNNINITEDLDEIFITCSVDLPNFDTSGWSTKNLKKYDNFEVYFNYFNNEVDRTNATITTLKLIFKGYIDSLPTSEDKTQGLTYSGLSCKSLLGLSLERTASLTFSSRPVVDLIQQGLNQTDLSALITDIQYDTNIPTFFTPSIDPTKYFGNVLEQLRDKYAIQIFQSGNGTMFVQRPRTFFSGEKTVYEYDLEENVFNIDYGDITQRVDTVVVLGTNAVGVAFDPVAYQLKQGGDPTSADITPDSQKLNPLIIIRRDFFDQESCQELAREKLVDLAKNYAISFDTIYEPDQTIGDLFIIQNSQKIPNTQKWVIKKRDVTISKDNIQCTITAYSNSIVDLPDDILLSSTGVLDTDILNLTQREVVNTVLE